VIVLAYSEDKKAFTLATPYKQASIAQAAPDRRWSKRTKQWTLPAVRKNLEYINAVRNANWRISDEAQAVLDAAASFNKRAIDGMPSWFTFNKPPLEHQLTHMNRAIGLDFYAYLFEQGLGKTFTSINTMACWRMMMRWPCCQGRA